LEPLVDVASLLVPTPRAGVESEAFSASDRAAASSAAFFTTTASAIFFIVATSLAAATSTAFLAATATAGAASLGHRCHFLHRSLRSGWGTTSFRGGCCPNNEGSPTGVSSLWYNFLFFSGSATKANDAPASLRGDQEPVLAEDPEDGTCSFPLLELGLVHAPPWPPAVFVSGIYMPQDWSSNYHTAISISSNVGISFSSCDLATWSKQIGMQGVGG
jgi:hypothetical protein